MDHEIKLRKIANQTIFYQISTLIAFLTISIGFQMNGFLLLLFIPLFFIYSCYILIILVFQDNLCPHCGNYFFKQKDSFANLGLSIYHKKCTNCLYKLNSYPN